MAHLLKRFVKHGFLSAAIGAAAASLLGATRVEEPKAVASPVAIVELFTSEGCSSCPAADEVVSDLVAKSRKDGAAVYPISFHVDYWNNLGWKDRFSAAAFTQRQYEYVRVLGLASAYTPQMVVNGRAEFVGNDSERAKAEVATALRQVSTVSVGLTAVQSHGKVTVSYSAGGDAKGKTLQVVLVQRGLETKVRRGENSNRTLHHDNVARSFQSVAITDSSMNGSVVLELPTEVSTADIAAGRVSVVAYVQDGSTLRVLGGAAVDLK